MRLGEGEEADGGAWRGMMGLDVRAEAWGLESSSTPYNPPSLFALLERP